MKTCTVCKEAKKLDEYYKCTASKDGKGYRCKECDNLARKSWTINNSERAAYSSRNRALKWKYGIDIPTYDRMLATQKHCCAICGDKENKVGGLHNSFSVDHDHTTGKVRGLLCNQCNRGLGMLGDNIKSIMNVVKYLENNNDTH
jgi:hypothetical protein